MEIAVTIVAALIMVIGLVGVFVPIVPGLGLLWVTALVHGFVVGWTSFGITIMVILTLITAASVVVGIVVPRNAAADSGVAFSSQVLMFVGAIIGFFAIPYFGLPIGALVGVLIAEYLDKGDWTAARESTVATAKGFGISALIQFAMGFVMVGLWSIWAIVALT